MAGRFHALRVAAIDRLTEDAAAVTFEVPAALADEYRFLPGQHVIVRCPAAGDDKRRAYSLCSPPPTLRIGVKRIPNGVFSRYVMEEMRPGDVVDVMTPTGRFVPSPDPGIRRRTAVCAGSGITPVLSMMAAALAADSAAVFQLVYGNRSTASVMFLDEIADLKDRYPDRLEVVHVFSREPRESELLTGRLDRAKIAALLDAFGFVERTDEWFVCGPLGVIEAARAELRSRGVPAERVHTELFHVDTVTAPRIPQTETGVATVQVRLGGRTTEVHVGYDQDVLHAVLPVRADVPYGCTNGMCGTCRARLVAGDVVMRQCYALDEADRAAGFVLTCQAMPRTPRISLDYDA
ncbi:Oxidoreductase FAD-binding domain protein [Acidothermus cellulolyticus 11B]|uniref:Oxidoreductase FAD-binding domain protein n=1 Tax=Acidothermus cellulolyticus (strain ATCC 43068 / DSM 8971 / 11B) TaxID=351607 RepID=A0LUV1_ACIC1|nr:2Fe-2S iron-sulfur cluster-binding protein [Acidothermus cellulolyticus]ABK53211.1 Oxidoreductase FAD-binding domain protein [Acidothermus cellulolyticus 11B]